MNEWEKIYTILRRIAEGSFVSDSDRKAVADVTVESHLAQHADIFARFIVPRDRKYGAKPGEPTSWSQNGSFFDLSRDTIRSVCFPRRGRSEVITGWGHMLPGGQTMFVLKYRNRRWLIDSIKTRMTENDGWETEQL
jgi:hypothetical protein